MLNQYLHSHFAPAFLFLPPARRRALSSLYDLCRVLDDAVDKPMNRPAEFLDAWRQVFVTGQPDSVRRYGQDIFAQEFLAISKTYDIPLFILLDLIDKGVSVDLQTNRFATPMDTESYCYGVAGTVGIACLPIFGVPWEQAKNFAVRLGVAVQWTNILRDVGADAKMGRIYLPLEHLERFGCSEEDILQNRSTPGFRQLMDFEGSLALSHYERAMDLMPPEWLKELKPARIMGKIYLKLLEKLKAQGYPVFEKRVSLNLFEKGYATLNAL